MNAPGLVTFAGVYDLLYGHNQNGADMKPLLCIPVFGREKETRLTIESLIQTRAISACEIVLWDNGSTEDLEAHMLDLQETWEGVQYKTLGRNIGCPRALNEVLAERMPGQPFIKLDNDVVLETPDWVALMAAFMAEHPEIAMVSPWYEELETSNQGRIVQDHGDWLEIFPVIGHCCWHAGGFMDQVEFFDVLGEGHLYGFEDLLMAHRAGTLGYKCAVLKTVACRMIQRWNSLDVAREAGRVDQGRSEHVEAWRLFYNKRRSMIKELGDQYIVDREGRVYIA